MVVEIGRRDTRAWVRQMEQQKPTIYEIELTVGKSRLGRASRYASQIRQSLPSGQAVRLFDLCRVQIDPADAARRPHQRSEQPTHRARSETEVRNDHTL
jgi:hypothetical protein